MNASTVANMLLASLTLYTLVVFTVASDDWGYGDDDGPETWPGKWETCGGAKQSPLNVNNNIQKKNLGRFTTVGLSENIPEGATMNLQNMGHTVQVNLEGEYLISGADLPSEYKIIQFHFHWGSVSTQGSEHQVDGKQYAAEMHLVGFDHLHYASLTEALEDEDGVSVIGTLIEIGDDNNTAYDNIVNNLQSVIYPDQIHNYAEPFPILPMLPQDLTQYYRYEGSLTTPECNQAVVWTVMTTPVKISEAQMEQFRSLMFSAEGETAYPMVDNYRPPQTLGDRFVFQNDLVGTDGGSSIRTSFTVMAVVESLLFLAYVIGA